MKWKTMENKITELMGTVKECLEFVINESSTIATEFQMGNTGKANQKLINYIENVSCLVSAVDALRGKNVDLVANVKIGELQKVLEEMEKAMLSQDYVLLADILEYEIKEVLVEIQGNF